MNKNKGLFDPKMRINLAKDAKVKLLVLILSNKVLKPVLTLPSKQDGYSLYGSTSFRLPYNIYIYIYVYPTTDNQHDFIQQIVGFERVGRHTLAADDSKTTMDLDFVILFDLPTSSVFVCAMVAVGCVFFMCLRRCTSFEIMQLQTGHCCLSPVSLRTKSRIHLFQC